MKHLAISLIAASQLLIVGCAQKGIANQDEFDQLAHQKAEEYVGNTRSALEKAEDAYTAAKSEQFSILTPLHWQQMTLAIKKARTADLEGDSVSSLEASAWVMTYYDSALNVKKEVEAQLGEVLAQQQVLLSLKSDKILRRDYRKRVNELRQLTRTIESGQTDKVAEDGKELLEEMQQLELDTMLEIHWRPARKVLDKAEDEGTDDFAPETFAIAERLTRKAHDTIQEHYQKRDICSSIGLEALRAAQHALYIGREAEKIINMDIDDAEEAALRFEEYLHQIATALSADDLRNMAFLDQTLALVQKTREQKAAAEKPLLKEIEQLKRQLKALQLKALPAQPDDQSSEPSSDVADSSQAAMHNKTEANPELSTAVSTNTDENEEEAQNTSPSKTDS